MKNEIVANSCRVCLTKTKKLRSLYKAIDEGDEPPHKMLQLITGIKVEKMNEHETLPKNICKNCELSLSMAFEFRENALKTQQIIIEHLYQLYDKDSHEGNKSSIYKNEYEDIMNLEPLDCVDELEEDVQNLSNDQHKYCLENEELTEIVNNEDNFEERNDQEDEFYTQHDSSCCTNDSKENNSEVKSTDNYAQSQHEGNDDEKGNDETEQKLCRSQRVQYTEMVSAEEENSTNVHVNPTNLIKTKSTKTKHQQQKKQISKVSTKAEKSKGKIYDINIAEKLVPRRGRKPTNANNQNGHICDICGNVFAKRGRMMEHRQRHDKECRFCCEICDKKFCTRELLRKHMFSHSGGKPLKCEFCSRSFYYESVRKAHESVHRGLRPYVCDVCGKSFSYAHALKKHKLIHAEIKLYRCEYCNKDFRLQHHMKQHELTKLHQNAVRFAKSDISFENDGEMLDGDEDLNDDILLIEEMSDEHLGVDS